MTAAQSSIVESHAGWDWPSGIHSSIQWPGIIRLDVLIIFLHFTLTVDVMSNNDF